MNMQLQNLWAELLTRQPSNADLRSLIERVP